MTVIPKIIIDNVVKQPLISKDCELEVEPCKTPSEIDASLPCALEQEEKSICKKQLPVVEVISPVVVEDIRNHETITLSPEEKNDIIEQISCEDKNAAIIKQENDIVIQEPDVVSDCGCKSKEEITLCDRKCDEIPKDVLTSEVPREIHNIDHPRVLHPIKLSNDIENVEILGAGNVNISLEDNCPQRIEKYERAEDVALEHLLQKSLVPFINLKTNDKPKLLVSYPVVGNPKEIIPEHPSAIIVRTLKPVHTYCSKCSSCGNRRPKIVDIDNLNIIRSTPIIPVVEVVPNNICKCSKEFTFLPPKL
ncbi:hypothetical protein WA026_002544 [Henosepilachna vigintioctopunctata]|uniref:Uncharacterized protein n=1 Tax=Henosepilachna vigintioctopunctata TaxID=420089 RepID=A0AAW1U0P3_9CUCU